MKKRIIAVLCFLAMLFSMTTLGSFSSAAAGVWLDKDMPQNLDYSFAVIGDIQSLSYFDADRNTTYLEDMFDWILDNKEERKIEYIFELGDTVETLTTYPEKNRNPLEWIMARTQFRRLYNSDGSVIIPYMVVRGNHDDEKGYHKYVCNENYQAQMDEFFYDSEKPATLGNSMSNSYRKIEIGNHKYLMLGLDYNADDTVLNWASEVISANPDYKVIISIHAYLNGRGSFLGGTVGSSNADNTELEYIPFSGQDLWNKLFRRHENIFMVLCGHASVRNPVVNTRTGLHGNKIIEILVDPQSFDWDQVVDYGEKAGGFVLMVNVTNGGECVELEYYSTAYKKYFEERNQRVIELDEGTLPKYVAPVTTVVTTTDAMATTEITMLPDELTQSKGCRSTFATGVAICCSIGTSLAAFAMRRIKED